MIGLFTGGTQSKRQTHGRSPSPTLCLSSSFLFLLYTFQMHPPFPPQWCAIKCNFYPNWVLMTEVPLDAFQSFCNEAYKIIKWNHIQCFLGKRTKKFPETAFVLLKLIRWDYLQIFVGVFDINKALMKSRSRLIHWGSALNVTDELVVKAERTVAWHHRRVHCQK